MSSYQRRVTSTGYDGSVRYERVGLLRSRDPSVITLKLHYLASHAPGSQLCRAECYTTSIVIASMGDDLRHARVSRLQGLAC